MSQHAIHGHVPSQGILFILLISILTTISWYWIKDKNFISNHNERQICIPCQNLSLSPDEDFENFREFYIQNNSGVVECCVRRKNIDEHVELFTERQTRLSNALDEQNSFAIVCGYNEPLPSGMLSAKLVGLNYTEEQNLSDTLIWNEADAKSYIGSNVTYSNGRISVRESGFYHVYTQVIFDESSAISIESDIFKTFCHFIYRHRAGTDASVDEKLTQSPQTLCNTKGFPSTGTSSIGSVFFLRDRDEVMVKVSNMQLIKFESLGNWFGLFKV